MSEIKCEGCGMTGRWVGWAGKEQGYRCASCVHPVDFPIVMREGDNE